MKKFVSAITALAMTVTAMTATASLTSSAEDIIKVACVGDSITDNGKSVFSYPAQLQEMLGSGYDVRNFGYGGTTAMRDGAPLSYWGRQEYTDSKAFQPDIVIFMLGTNDAAGDNTEKAQDHFRSDYRDLVKEYMNLASNPEVWIATAPETRDSTRRANIENIVIPAQLSVAEEFNLNVVNVHEATEKFFDYFTDGLHPNTPGYYLLAQVFFKDVFGKQIYNATVTAEPGTDVSVGGYSAKVGADGTVVIPVAEGDRVFTTNLVGYGSGTKTVKITSDTVVDMSDVKYVKNLAYDATPIDETDGRNYLSERQTLVNINDGDPATGWQLDGNSSDGMKLKNIWVGYDFGNPTVFDQVTIWWEEITACPENGFSVSYSNDGENWTAVSNFASSRANAIDVCTFDAVTARYVRVELKEASYKSMPQIYEVEVYNLGGGDTPEPTKGDVNADGVINSTDCMQIRRSFLGLFELSEDAKLRADVNEDDVINSTDFMQVRRHFLNQFDLFA